MLYNGAAGYQSDSATGLQLLGHRYYDPSIGRFLSSDPAQAGTNWYAYCDNNPLVGCDPTGFQAAAAVAGTLVAAPEVPIIVPILIGGALIIGAGWVIDQGIDYVRNHYHAAEHTKNKSQSKEGKHQKGRTRAKRDDDGEKGDKRRTDNKSKGPGSPRNPGSKRDNLPDPDMKNKPKIK